MYALYSHLKIPFLVMVTITTIGLTGCAVPVGAAFTAASKPPEGQAQVYIYRKSRMYASGQSFYVQLDKQDMGKLANGSYVQLQIPAGSHMVSVQPGVLSGTYTAQLQLKPGETAYLSVEVAGFLPNVTLNALMQGSMLNRQDPTVAQREMQGLRGMK
jgi:Protein of unknown function (DUF2846)